MSDEDRKQGMIPGGMGGLIQPPWDAEKATEMSAKGVEARRKKREALRLAALDGVRKAGKNLPGVSAYAEPEEIMTVLYEQHTLNAYDPSARNAVASLREIRSAAYPEPEKTVGVDSGSSEGQNRTLSALLALFSQQCAENPALAAAAAAALAAKEAGE